MGISIVIDKNGVKDSVAQENPLPVRIKNGVTGDDLAVATAAGQSDGSQKTQIIASDSPIFDAFSRLRTTSPKTLFDLQNEYNVAPLFVDRILVGAGTITHNDNESDAYFAVGTANGDSASSHTKQYFRYSPGKSSLILMSHIFAAAKTNVIQERGYGDTSNGMFFQVDGVSIGVVQRSSTSGSAVNTRVAQADWNKDKLNGTGASGITLDITKANIYFIDFEALYAGRVRFGIISQNGQMIVCHEFQNANSFTVPYVQTANLPLRVAIYNIGTAASGTTMKSICSSVITEDGDGFPQGVTHTASNKITSVAVTTRRPVLSIKPRLTFQSKVNRSLILNLSAEIMAKTNDAYWEIVYYGTLTGASFADIDTASSTMQVDTSATAITGGTVIASGFVISGLGVSAVASSLKNILSKLPIVVSMDGTTSIPVSVVVTSFTGTSNVNSTLSWEEIF